DDVKKLFENESDTNMPYPQQGYSIAQQLAAEIKIEFGQKKSDKEVVAFFANDYQDKNLRFVFDEYFISSLRWHI
ncbi:hypothetical protein, partial [Salmonella sp. s54925]|uniref:hypothetical protein n=1 Tax=Salmonella sp. s54925 TaxID=3159674 RepID=UPI0039805C1B